MLFGLLIKTRQGKFVCLLAERNFHCQTLLLVISFRRLLTSHLKFGRILPMIWQSNWLRNKAILTCEINSLLPHTENKKLSSNRKCFTKGIIGKLFIAIDKHLGWNFRYTFTWIVWFNAVLTLKDLRSVHKNYESYRIFAFSTSCQIQPTR